MMMRMLTMMTLSVDNGHSSNSDDDEDVGDDNTGQTCLPIHI